MIQAYSVYRAAAYIYVLISIPSLEGELAAAFYDPALIMYSCVSNIGESKRRIVNQRGQSASSHRSNPVVVVVIEVVVTCVPSLLAFKSERLSRKHEEGQHCPGMRDGSSAGDGLPKVYCCSLVKTAVALFTHLKITRDSDRASNLFNVCAYDKRTYTE